MTNGVCHPSDVWAVGTIKPWVSAMDESVRDGDLGDEAEEEQDEGVHYYDRPAMETMRGEEPEMACRSCGQWRTGKRKEPARGRSPGSPL